MDIALLVGASELDACASRVRAQGVACTVVRPCALRVRCEVELSPADAFFVGLSDDTSERVVAAMLRVSHTHLVGTLGLGLLACYPHATQRGESGVRVVHGTLASLLFARCSAPDTVPCALDGRGGPWVLVRADETGDGGLRLRPLGLDDGELLPTATALVARADGYAGRHTAP